MSDYSLLHRAHEALKVEHARALADKALVQDTNAALLHELEQLKAALISLYEANEELRKQYEAERHHA